MRRAVAAAIALGAAAVPGIGAAARAADGPLPVLPGVRHLGTPGKPEWDELAASRPDGPGLEVRFTAAPNPAERTLLVRQSDVKQPFAVVLNGKKLGELHPQEVPTLCALAIPPGALRPGENRLAIGPPRQPDDVIVGPISIDPRPLERAVGEASLALAVDEPGAGPIPARVTIVAEADEALPPLLAAPGERLAVRPGVVYMPAGAARVRLPAGRYRVTAGRGFEYGVDTRRVELAPGDERALSFRIRREVPTPGLVAADTHVHTYFFSRHGDASDDERAITLAGEGIELPIATEHNQHAGYGEATARLGLGARYTPVTGNEVTTPVGHFNVFPVDPRAPPPAHGLRDWRAILDGIRATPGVEVVILNHPRSLHTGHVPFAASELDPVTGAPRHGQPFAFDGLELVNSGAMRTDPMEVYRDWFAVLNRGHRVFGVGSSDSHDVARSIVGQARTYVAVADAAPGRIDLRAATRSFREGRLLVSLGLLVRLTVDGRHGVGDLATRLGRRVRVEATVLGPSWTAVDRLELYANGIKIRDERIADLGAGGVKARRTFELPRPAADTALVAVATGPGLHGLHWPTPRPYQPSGPSWRPRLIASTNPVWLDADGDGRFSAPRQTAQQLVGAAGGDDGRLIAALAARDEAVAIQAADLLRAAGRDLSGGALGERLGRAPEHVRRAFAAVANRAP